MLRLSKQRARIYSALERALESAPPCSLQRTVEANLPALPRRHGETRCQNKGPCREKERHRKRGYVYGDGILERDKGVLFGVRNSSGAHHHLSTERERLKAPCLRVCGLGKTSCGTQVEPAATLLERLPGLAQLGYTEAELQAHLSGDVADARARHASNAAAETEGMARLVETSRKHDASWPFLEPVDTATVTDYLSVVPDPTDLHTIHERCKVREREREGERVF